jgi:hypothetical protein
MTMKNTIVGVYDNYEQAQRATSELTAAGFDREFMQVTPYGDDQYPGQRIDGDQVSYAGVRALFGMDEDPGHHDAYAEAVRRGSYLVAINVEDDDIDRVVDIMSRFDPVDIQERTSHWKQQGWSGFDENAPALSKEEIEQDRVTYAQSDASATSRIPIVGDQPVLGMGNEQRNGVRVFRQTPDRSAAFGQPDPLGARSDDRELDNSDYQRHWQSAYSQLGGRYEDYDSAYRYGSTVAGSERFRNYHWAEVEPDLRSDWEAAHPESAWEKIKDAVRYGAEHMKARRPI